MLPFLSSFGTKAFEKVEILNEKDKAILRTEATNRKS